ncbi:MAG: hypothetical protein J5925_04480 [Clostridia bacterium]|nr:hypothetical protein [Clostridia bacterium]
MIKLAGACLAVVSAWACGFAAARAEGEKLTAADSLYSFVGRLERAISAARTPLKEFFARKGEDYLESCGFMPALRSGATDFCAAWEAALAKLPLESAVYAEAAAFGRDLGRLTLADQCAAANNLRSVIAESRGTLAAKLPLKQKSIRAAYLLAGLLAAIILI